MEQSKANLLIAILFQIRAVRNLPNPTPSKSMLSIAGVEAEMSRLMGEVLGSDEELDFSTKLVALQNYVETTQENLKVFEELDTILLHIQILLKQFGTNLNPHV